MSSYQHYAQLGKVGDSRLIPLSPGWQQPESPILPVSDRKHTPSDRPYFGNIASFSAPRTLHSSTMDADVRSPTSTTSTTASISPSNSASQRGMRPKRPKIDTSVDKGITLEKLKELEFGSASASSASSSGSKKQTPDMIHVSLPWRPPYLRRRVLVAFSAAFVAIIIILEVLLDLSNRLAGLGTVNNPASTRYLAQLALPAALLLLAGYWHRVEYQARSSAPWMRMSRGAADAERTMLIDYVSMIQPVAVYKAVRNRDFLVVVTVVVSMLLRVAVVFSTGLLAPSLVTTVDRAAPLQITAPFANGGGALLTNSTTPAQMAMSLLEVSGLQRNGQWEYPDGAASRFAYEQFEGVGLPASSQLGATVRGFFPNLTCETAQMALDEARPGEKMNGTIMVPNCSVSMLVGDVQAPQQRNGPWYFLRLGQGSCGGSTAPEERRIIVAFGIIDNPSGGNNSSVSGNAPRSTQLICQPGYNIVSVDVLKKGGGVVRAQRSTQSRSNTTMLPGVDAWDIASAVFDSYAQLNATNGAFLASETARDDTGHPAFLPDHVVVDAPMHYALGLRLAEKGKVGSATDYLDATTLAGLAADYFLHHAALVAHTLLARRDTSKSTSTVIGTSVVLAERLFLRSAIVHTVVSLLILCLVLAVAALPLAPKEGFLPRNPGSIMDTAALLGHSTGLLRALRGAGGADTEALWRRLGMAYFYTGVEEYEREYESGNPGYFKVVGGPLANGRAADFFESGGATWSAPREMHFLFRASVLLVMAGAIAALEVMLRSSEANDGLGMVDDGAGMHLVWTVVPALVLMGVVLYVGLLDSTTRALAPFVELASPRGASYRTLTVNFLDRAVPSILYQAFLGRNIIVVLSILSLLLASLTTVFIATAFYTSPGAAVVAVQLQTRNTFSFGGTASDTSYGMAASMRVLGGDGKFPPFTYQDLVFPNVSTMDRLDRGFPSGSSGGVITATLPALRAAMSCGVFEMENLGLKISGGRLRIDVPLAGPDGSLTIGLDRRGTLTDSFFGAGRYAPASDGGSWIYAWGQMDKFDSVRSVSAMACEETMQQVDVTASFRIPSMEVAVDDGLSIRSPVEMKSTVRDSPTFLAPEATDYTRLGSLDSAITKPHLLDGFFSALVTSSFAIPVTQLAASGTQAVADAIVFQHKILRAQALDARRQPISDSAIIPETDTNANPTSPPIAGTLQMPVQTSSSTTRRLHQDPITTRLMQSLLAATMACILGVWALDGRRRTTAAVLPRLRNAPLSIASTAALLADGNTVGLLGRRAEWKDNGELEGAFRDGLHVTMRFRLGWDVARGKRREKWDKGSMNETFGISTVRTGGWGGGENVGLGLQARVGYRQRGFVRDWGWRV